MLIENPDAFKSWLTSILEPLCDADPAALAKYVYALVKKEKPLEELREVMLDQLDVFLQHETKSFVEMLFKSLESREYLTLSAEKAQPSPLPEAAEPEKEIQNDSQHGENDECPVAPSNGTVDRTESVPETAARRVVVSRAPRSANPPPPGIMPTALPAPRNPPLEQTLVKHVTLTELLEEPVDQPPRRRDRRPDNQVRDKEDRRRRRSRSWERRPRRRHPRDIDHERRDRRPSSRSPSPRGRYRNRSPPALLERPATRSRSRSPIPVRDHERERERLRPPRELERDRMSRDREHMDRITRSRDRDRSRDRSLERSRGSLSPSEARLEVPDAYKRRCRDYDEKGYCMRGDLCQWDHGTDPVVLEDPALSGVFTIPPPVPEYNPATPHIWGGLLPPAPHPPLVPHHAPRELVPVPRVRDMVMPPAGALVVPAMPPPRHPGHAGHPGHPGHPPNKKNFDYNRLGAPRGASSAGNCSLEVRKIPRGMNDITHLNNHFNKFGKITNIKVYYEGDPEAALITFSNHTEANVAYKSTEAVLNNRFIKVFWHNPENKQENTAPPGQPTSKPSAQHPASQNKVLINRDNIKATADNKQLADKEKEKEKPKIEPANGQQEPAKDATTKQPVERIKRVMDRYQRAQELLKKQLDQQRKLIQKLESGNVTGTMKVELSEAISSAQEAIEKLNKELLAYKKILEQLQEEGVARSLGRLRLAQANNKKPKTREEMEKEILDAELDMFTKQQEGVDVTEQAKKIAEMRSQLALRYPPHPPFKRALHSRGGRFNPSLLRFSRVPGTPGSLGGASGAPGQHKVFVNQSVDHRPRALRISGFELDEMDSLITHFSQFGEIVKKETVAAVPELVLQYRARAQAEQALLRGRHYNDRTLSITWVNGNKPFGPSVPTQNGDLPARPNSEQESTPQETIQESLLRFDEEEEDEADEERSWRR